MKQIALIDAAPLEAVGRLAADLPRLRENRNFHASAAEPCNRLPDST